MKKRKNYDELLSLINDLQQRITELNNKNEKLQEEKKRSRETTGTGRTNIKKQPDYQHDH